MVFSLRSSFGFADNLFYITYGNSPVIMGGQNSGFNRSKKILGTASSSPITNSETIF